MANHHINGDNPYRMSGEEATIQEVDWILAGGGVRSDEPHQGNPEPHKHFYDTVQSEDILVNLEDDGTPTIREADDDSKENSDDDSESESNNEDEEDDD